MAVVLWSGAHIFARLFISSHEQVVIGYTARFLHVSVSFFVALGVLSILRYSIQGAGYTKLAMGSGVSEMIARVAVSVLAVPVWGYWAICFGDPIAWCCACLFLVPAFFYVYRQLKRRLQVQPV